MATALHPTRNDPAANVHVNLYPRAVMTELEFKDNRYPAIPQSQPPPRNPQHAGAMYAAGPSDRTAWDASPNNVNANPTNRSYSPTRSFDPYSLPPHVPTWSPDSKQQPPSSHQQLESPTSPSQYRSSPSPDTQSFNRPQLEQRPHQQQTPHPQQLFQQEPPRSALSYALPPGPARRVVERYSLDNDQQSPPSPALVNAQPNTGDSPKDVPRSRSGTPLALRPITPQDPRQPSQIPTPRSPPIPIASIGAGGANLNVPGYSSPIMPLSASPGYTPPVSPNLRAYPQQPTYITPPAAPTPINPVYSPKPQEEVCVECAMRDQDMADVDVTSPGVWERDSDVLYEELLRRETEEEVSGTIVADESRPRAKGGRLTEQNLKLWLSVNPREPASRQQTLNNYIKSQRALLEAEALAHARAMQEAKQLDNRMRDAYSQLRRSAYDTGNTAAPVDDLGGVRIKPPKSPVSPVNPHARSHSRDVTLLENGMIVEHVDVRREEREARERRRREEKRARKSSRSSAIDAGSIMSGATSGSIGAFTDGGLGLRPQTRYSQVQSARPASVLTAPGGGLPATYSQTSFSDFHSLNSASPRRTRFFGLRSIGSHWKSQDSLAPSGMSGSMINMHLAGNRDSIMPEYGHQSPDPNLRQSQMWPPNGISPEKMQAAEEKAQKKRKGLAKFWQIITGQRGSSAGRNSGQPPAYDKQVDDGPLPPPPPLSYLVNRGNLLSNRNGHASTPSLTTSPRNGLSSPGMSPSTAPSSTLPSPASVRSPGPDLNMGVEIKFNGSPYEEQDAMQFRDDDTAGKTPQNNGSRNLHSMTSEPDMRNRMQAVNPSVPVPPLPNMTQVATTSLTPQSRSVSSVSREKSLPPLPGEPRPRTMGSAAEMRPMTVYDSRPAGTSPPHDFLPPSADYRDTRRQSFSGIPSRPNLTLQNVPQNPQLPQALSPRYDEFGRSRKSLTQEELTRPSSSRRKSRFGLSSLLGKKHNDQESNGQENTQQVVGRPGSDAPDEHTATGHASTSRHSGISNGNTGANLRQSIVGRKPLEELVAQDPEFLAYRYPSNDQRLDLLR